ncbi:DNA gyrase subunit B [Candidatus Wolfebacteria bacterium]|nr:MAG: DNA gyrase subunit B [Candidatus Wolfebacteria bacterium]
MAKKDDKKAGKGHHYDAQDITVLEGLDPVRKRPGMYIGTTGPDGLHHLIWEIFDNSRDEAMGGFADDVEVVLLPDNKVRVVDNGRGIPVDMHKKTKVSALETIMTTLHAGGKFGGDGYKVSGGLHGVGASVVNALSTYARAEVHRGGDVYFQEYSEGKQKAKVKKLGKTKHTGTIITFSPDATIFKEGTDFEWKKIIDHLRQQAYLVKGLRITVIDAREEDSFDSDAVVYVRDLELDVPSMTFYFEGGLKSLVQFQNENQKALHKNIFYVDKELDDVTVEVALQYVDDISSRITPFANNIHTAEGGTHLTGFKTALTRTINAYGRKNGLIKEKDENFTGDDVLEGLTAVISVKIPDPQFEGQTKAKLGSTEAQGAVANVFGDALASFLEENPDDARVIINKSLLALRARKAAKAAKDNVMRKGALEGITLPGKLADCQSKDPALSEIFIVEGDSAGGCFSADTKVALTDGRDISFVDLIKEDSEGKTNFCYTIKEDGTIGTEKVTNPRRTKLNAELVEVTLDNGEKIKCTPNHKFMMRDGVYIEAQNLQSGSSLMPLYRQFSKIGKRITIEGYEMVLSPNEDRWIFTHMLSDEWNLANDVYEKNNGTHRHHVDFNKLNNNPANILRLSKDAHLEVHQKHASLTLHTPLAKEKARIAHQKPEYKLRASEISKKHSAMLSEKAKKQWSDPVYKKYMGEQFLKFYNSNEKYREENIQRLNQEQKKYWSVNQNVENQAIRVKKHFSENPKAKKYLSELAHDQWKDEALRTWRAEKTKKQWTADFRAKRKEALNKTYYQKSMSLLKELYDVDQLGKYDEVRIEQNDKSRLTYQSVLSRYFEQDNKKLLATLETYNHKVLSIKKLQETQDVYDIEVSHTHNFALASGVFVHNSAKQGRDRVTQAIMPLKGKILNVERARLDKMLAHTEIKSLVVALGTAIGDVFDIDKLRYHKIIIATDADVDGAHIRTLLLTLLYRYFKPLIEGGFVYVAQPPLYKIKKGKEVLYFYTEDSKTEWLKKEGINLDDEADAEADPDEDDDDGKATPRQAQGSKKAPKVSIQRYKGLGEMNPEELWETTMDPERRVLKQVTIDDGTAADKVFDVLMGTDVAARKAFIQSNAKMATLDV